MSTQNVILLKIMKVTTNWESMHHSWTNVEHNQALLETIINSQISSSGGKLHPTFTSFLQPYTSNIPRIDSMIFTFHVPFLNFSSSFRHRKCQNHWISPSRTQNFTSTWPKPFTKTLSKRYQNRFFCSRKRLNDWFLDTKEITWWLSRRQTFLTSSASTGTISDQTLFRISK